MRYLLIPTCSCSLLLSFALTLDVDKSFDAEAATNPINSRITEECTEPQVREQHLQLASEEPRFVGTDSCVHCHKDGHQNRAYEVAGKEYSIWINEDRHSCAFNTLFNEQSKSIALNLTLDTPPHKNDLCLNCHSTNVPRELIRPGSELNLADGVGCESCHGGAEKWLEPHKRPDWKYLSQTEKATFGFVNTANIASRARKCVECHVGSEGRDVNHDLIAAGHPRLYFEMSAHQAKMPRHWSREKDLRQNTSTLEARIWLVGQFVSAVAALDNLERRAKDSHAPWPEFSEYACASCHHDLAAQRGKQEAGHNKFGTGQPAWGTWHFSLLEHMLRDSSMLCVADIADELVQLKTDMQWVLPDRELISVKSENLKLQLSQLADIVAQSSLKEQEMIFITDQLFQKRLVGDDLNWDVLTQRYLAAVALRQSIMDARWSAGRLAADEFRDSSDLLIKIRDSLKFIEDYNGPKKLDSIWSRELNRGFSEVFSQLKN